MKKKKQILDFCKDIDYTLFSIWFDAVGWGANHTFHNHTRELDSVQDMLGRQLKRDD